MKSKILHTAVSFSAFLWALLPAKGQSENQVSMRIDLVAWGDSIPGLTLKSAKGREPVTALPFRYSRPISYSGPAVLEIFQGGAGNSAPAAEAPPPAVVADPHKDIRAALAGRRKKEPDLVALAILPPASRHVTVLLAPADAGTYQAYVIDDDPSKLPYGQMRVHNLSPLPIAIRCNNTPTKILETKGTVVVVPDNREIIYELAYQQEGEWEIQENNITVVREDEQAQLVVLKSDNEFFTSKDGSRSGFLQTVVLRRDRRGGGDVIEPTDSEKAELLKQLMQEEDKMVEEAQRQQENHGP
jgi:hypothetical protein